MTIAWTLYVLFAGSLVACAALAVDGILRRTQLPTRWVWVTALSGIVALAAAAPRAPVQGRGPGMSAIAPTTLRATGAAADASIVASMNRAIAAIGASANDVLKEANARVPSSIVMPLAAAWALISSVLLVVIIVVNRRTSHERRAWPLTRMFDTEVRIAPEAGPAVVGLARPEIVLPRWLLLRSREEQRLVVVHEREHVAARDQLLPVGGWIVAALLPWHPAVWWSLSRLRLAVELDCDSRVLRNQGVQARSYGTLLIDIAGQCAGHRVGALALADRPSHLERRLLAMQPTRTRFLLLRSGTLTAIAALSILVACEARMPTSADVENMDVTSAEKAMVQAKLVDAIAAKRAVYTLDGLVVTADEAHAVMANRVASVSIKKNKLANGNAEVAITTSNRAADTISGVPMTIHLAGGGVMKSENGAVTSGTAFNGVLLVDGVQKPASMLATIRRENIDAVEVIKGKSVLQLSSDPAAANGIIKITMKHDQP